ncbi:MAG: 30S ribosomal protein S20 [Planctomycetes bacterium]|nr:30S ribosomal protein S20 [Planctomycetota bacterium]
MPNTASAKKRVRQNATRRAENRWRKLRIKDQVKTFLKAVQEQDVATAETEFRKTCGLLDRVSTTSTIHRNTAARRKSRLSRRLKALKEAKGS